MWLKQSSVYLKISRGTRIRLNVNTPLVGIKSKSFKRSPLAEGLYFINILITAVIAFERQTLAVFIGETCAKAIKNSPRCEVFGGD